MQLGNTPFALTSVDQRVFKSEGVT